MEEIKLNAKVLNTENDSTSIIPNDENQDYSSDESTNDDDNDNLLYEISDADGTYSFGQVARMLGIEPNNLRYYVDQYIEFINPTRSSPGKRGNYRFTEEGVNILRTVFLCRDNKLSKAEILEVLKGNIPSPAMPDEERLRDISLVAQKVFRLYGEQLIKSQESVQQRLLEDRESIVDTFSEMLEKKTNGIEVLLNEQENRYSNLLEAQHNIIQEMLNERAKKDDQINELLEKINAPRKKGFFSRFFD